MHIILEHCIYIRALKISGFAYLINFYVLVGFLHFLGNTLIAECADCNWTKSDVIGQKRLLNIGDVM